MYYIYIYIYIYIVGHAPICPDSHAPRESPGGFGSTNKNMIRLGSAFIMYVCIAVYIYIYIYIYVYVYIYIYIFLFVYLSIYLFIDLYIYLSTHMLLRREAAVGRAPHRADRAAPRQVLRACRRTAT